MSSDDINAMLDNLAAIKSGDDPRQERPDDDALELMKGEVDRLYDEYESLSESLQRRKVWCGVAQWDGRNGYCKYNTRLTKRRFNKKITQTERATGCATIVVNEKILQDGNRSGFLDTVRHELAHAICYAEYMEYPSRQRHRNYNPRFAPHGPIWKDMAIKLGADPSSTHHKRDRSDEYKYYIGCPNCGKKYGKTKRSKVIKQPFNRKCGLCGHSPLSSFDAGDSIPDESGVVAVESISWDDKSEWFDAGMP